MAEVHGLSVTDVDSVCSWGGIDFFTHNDRVGPEGNGLDAELDAFGNFGIRIDDLSRLEFACLEPKERDSFDG